MAGKNIANALAAFTNRGICEVSGVPRIIDVNQIKTGDKVVMWHDSPLDGEIKKGTVCTVSFVDKESERIGIKESTQNYRYDKGKENGWEYWLFCLPEDYNESGIYLSRLNNEPKRAVEFAGRKIYSKYEMDLSQFDIPWKSLKRDFFAEIEHPQIEIMFQDLYFGISRLYLAKYQGYWLLLHRIRCELDWLIGSNLHSYTLSMIMPAEENDRKPVVAQILLGLWLFHYNECYGRTAHCPLEKIESEYLHEARRGGSNSVGYLVKQQIARLIHDLDGKTIPEASAYFTARFSG